MYLTIHPSSDAHVFFSHFSFPTAGESAEFDVFISYRCNADLDIAEALYNALTALGVTVWWDKKCLLPGEDWEENFCRGLVKSRVFLPIYSRNAINHPTYARQSFALLTPDSNCDNMFLEQRLALELRDRGLIEKVILRSFNN